MLDAADDTTTALPVPSLEALMASTVALMTAWAHPTPDTGLPTAQCRGLLARRIVCNLFFLQNHPHASTDLRQVMARAHVRWVATLTGSANATTQAHGDMSPSLLH